MIKFLRNIKDMKQLNEEQPNVIKALTNVINDLEKERNEIQRRLKARESFIDSQSIIIHELAKDKEFLWNNLSAAKRKTINKEAPRAGKQ